MKDIEQAHWMAWSFLSHYQCLLRNDSYYPASSKSIILLRETNFDQKVGGSFYPPFHPSDDGQQNRKSKISRILNNSVDNCFGKQIAVIEKHNKLTLTIPVTSSFTTVIFRLLGVLPILTTVFFSGEPCSH